MRQPEFHARVWRSRMEGLPSASGLGEMALANLERRLDELIYCVIPARMLLGFTYEVSTQLTLWRLGLEAPTLKKIAHGHALLRYLELLREADRRLTMSEWVTVGEAWDNIKADRLLCWEPLPRINLFGGER